MPDKSNYQCRGRDSNLALSEYEAEVRTATRNSFSASVFNLRLRSVEFKS